MNSIASGLAFGISDCKGVGANWGNLKFICAASFTPSGHVAVVGDPITLAILYNSCKIHF